MKNSTFNWGIIGPGKIARKFAEDLAKVPGARLYAVASRSLERAEEFARRHSCPKSYGSYRELAEDDQVDIVYIATPHVFHYENTMLCLKQKKAVLCEKPLAMNREQVKEMIKTSREEGTFLMEGLWTRFLPHFKEVMKLVQTEKYGKLLKMKADFGFEAALLPEKRLYNKALGGGSLLDVGIYPVFAVLSLMGKPDDLSAKAIIGETGVDESCSVIFRYNDGRKAFIESSIKITTPTIATLYFEKAKILINNRFHEPTTLTIAKDNKEEILNFKVDTYGYNFEAAHVQKMLIEGKAESDSMSLDTSLELTTLLDKIREEIGLEY